MPGCRGRSPVCRRAGGRVWLLGAAHLGAPSAPGAGRGAHVGHCAHPSTARLALGSLHYDRGSLPSSPGAAGDRLSGAGGLAPALAGDAGPAALPGLSSGRPAGRLKPRRLQWYKPGHRPMPTVSLTGISLVASSCGYERDHIEQRAAHEFAVHVATERGRAKRPPLRHLPRAQPVAPMRERHCSRPRLPPRRGTAQARSRDLGHPGAHTEEATTPSPHHATGCAAHPTILFSPPGHGFSGIVSDTSYLEELRLTI